ncbi:MAG: hypothetical protein M3P51_05525, partial [Chloroflexota bacterium]|nr:hypothetical protein [Chloroflexota bacterium]
PHTLTTVPSAWALQGIATSAARANPAAKLLSLVLSLGKEASFLSCPAYIDVLRTLLYCATVQDPSQRLDVNTA